MIPLLSVNDVYFQAVNGVRRLSMEMSAISMPLRHALIPGNFACEPVFARSSSQQFYAKMPRAKKAGSLRLRFLVH
jgi:hypothetical protein